MGRNKEEMIVSNHSWVKQQQFISLYRPTVIVIVSDGSGSLCVTMSYKREHFSQQENFGGVSEVQVEYFRWPAGDETVGYIHVYLPCFHLSPAFPWPQETREISWLKMVAWLRAAWVYLWSHPVFEINTNQMLLIVIRK